MDTGQLTYALVTAARNEGEFIGATIASVICQVVRPAKWVIVSDGSTDATDDIVKKYAREHGWIELVRMPERQQRHFAGKAHAFNTGCARLKDVNYDLIGNLDADITFDPDFFAFLLGKFAENPRLGVAGAAFQEGNSRYDYRFSSIEHVSGQCQLFRRACFEGIGGYAASKGGGIDVIAVLTARMNGWETRTFPEKTYFHHRAMGSAKSNRLMTGFRLGEKDYLLGRHPVWQIFRSVYQMTRRPYVIGGGTILIGYWWAALRRVQRPVSVELIRFERDEQMMRLKAFLHQRLPLYWPRLQGLTRR